MRRLALVALLVTGCLGAPDDGDGERPDAAPDRLDAGGENLLPNGDFEIGLAGWDTDATNADLFDDGPSHGGERSASVCLRDVPLPDYYFLFWTELVAVDPGSYRFTAWARVGEGAGGQLLAGVISGADLYVTSPSVAVGDAWEPVAVEVTLAEANQLTVAIRAAPSGAGDCFVVDDAQLVRQ
ncbi:MAG TPA: hypothetical protein VMZ28_12615 [Kofleriaceae bacterium]|nr:hypothetical protein [Kofleriaceae bacterium]